MKWRQGWAVVAVVSTVLGCNHQQVEESRRLGDASRANEFLLALAPPDAQSVIEVRNNATADQSVVVTGRIGGSDKPWVAGRAAFSIVDCALQACSDKEGDHCETPWDYCCETDRLAKAMALVKVVDDGGNLVATDARALLSVKELQTVVVQGTAQRDEAGNLTILARGVYVTP